ncbi:MAG: hypothetical protein ACXVEE_44020 [Polyangiales bacterium]
MRILLLATALLAACDRGIAATSRKVVARGLPACPAREAYSRPIVLRIDRDRSLFDEPMTAHEIVYGPAASASIVVPRTRMKATLRIGSCALTSVATWDCNAASWLASTPIELDGRSADAEVQLPAVSVPCSVPSR